MRGIKKEEEDRTMACEKQRGVEACGVRRSGIILKTLFTHINPSPYWVKEEELSETLKQGYKEEKSGHHEEV